MAYAFIRHGETNWNRDGLIQGSSDIPLNDTGREQAREAAGILEGTAWDAIVSSNLRRARETAHIIADELGMNLGPAYPDLNERDYGPLEGMAVSEAHARWPSFEYPGAEDISVMVARATASLTRISADYPDQRVAIVCHGTLIRSTLEALSGRRIGSILNGSISEFRLTDDRWDVLTVNGKSLCDASST